MNSKRARESSQSALQLLAARDAVQEVVDALEAFAEGKMPNLSSVEVDPKSRESLLRECVRDFEMPDGATLLAMIFGDGSPLCREQAKRLAANLRHFAGADKSS
jgi:hypothetical protein